MALMKRGLLAVALAGLLGGCVGPRQDMVTNDWKLRRERPVVLDPDFEYRGEHFEQVYDAEETED